MEHLNVNPADSSDNIIKLCHQNNNSLNIYHQNIRGVKDKTNEIVSSLYPLLPHLLCITEHHLNHLDLRHTHIEHYNISADYCRQTLRQGGVCIFVHDTINYLNAFCKEQDLEACAIKLQFPFGNIYILAIYRAPTGDFSYFLIGLEAIFKSSCNMNSELIICGDFNVNYLDYSNRRK
jgi:exonuclease III